MYNRPARDALRLPPPEIRAHDRPREMVVVYH